MQLAFAGKRPSFVSTLVLPEGGAVIADTGAIGGRHENVIGVAADQVAQHAAGGGAGAGEGLASAGGFHIVAHCIDAGAPEHVGSTSTTHHLAAHVRGSTWLWRGKQIQHQSPSMKRHFHLGLQM